MVNHEPLVTHDDLNQVHLDIGSRVIQAQVAELFEREPKLAETMSQHWERINKLFNAFGLDSRQQAALTAQITLLATKPLVLLDRAHRRQWDGMLPMTTGGAHE